MSDPQKIRIYYLASGPIGIPLLEALRVAPDIELVGVASQLKNAKETAGHARTSTTALVKYCDRQGIDVQRYLSVNTDEFREMLARLNVELLVVASFGQILRPALLELPRYGCLNIHASLLPKYRGAAPVTAALLNGDAKTGVSFMKMEAGLDTGPVYRTFELEIRPEDASDTLETRLGECAAQHVNDVIVDIVRKGLVPVPQDDSASTYAKKIAKEDGNAKWDKSARELANMVRAYTPWPSLKTTLPTRNGTVKMIKIMEAIPLNQELGDAKPGQILSSGKEGILVACGQGALLITRLTPEGRKAMTAADYLLGTPLPKGESFAGDSTII